MPITYPIPEADFIRLLNIAQVTFDDPENVESNNTGGGEVMRAELGPQLWRGEVRLATVLNTDLGDVDTILSLLRGPDRTFFCFDTRRPFPRMDPDGTILGGAATVTIMSLPSAQEIRLQGLPVGYVLSRGDFIAFNYGTPSRRALHRVVDPVVTANASGQTPIFEVQPNIRPGAVTGATVFLRRPACKAVLVPGSVNKGVSQPLFTSGMSFRWQQTLR